MVNNISIIKKNDIKIWLSAINSALANRWNDAVINYEKLLYKYPENSQLYYEASMAYIKVENYTDAFKCMDLIYDDFLNNIDYLNDFCIVCTKLKVLGKAEFLAKRALNLEPKNTDHLINLAAIYNLNSEYQLAIDSINSAIQIDPLESRFYNMLGVTLIKNGIDIVAQKMFEIALKIKPDYTDPKVNLAIMLARNNRHDEAIKIYESLLILDNREQLDLEVIRYSLSFSYLALGFLELGWEYYDYGFNLNINPNNRRSPTRGFKKPKWDGIIRKNATILIWREQGVGDEIAFYTCLPDLILTGMNIVIECDERLCPVLKRSFPTCKIRKNEYLNNINLDSIHDDYDFHLPAGSLMRYFRRNVKEFTSNVPIFKVDENLATYHEENLIKKQALKKRIGICWRSGFLNMERNTNYLVIEDLIPIFSYSNYEFINLQYGDCEAELLNIEKLCNINIIRWENLDLKEDIDSVMALISRLDLVITVGTAVSTIAASIGKPVFLIGRRGWDNLGTNYYPFFPSIECFFPSEGEMLSDCISRVQSRLLNSTI